MTKDKDGAGEPQGSYFGLTVTDGYDWHQCYSWAWECRNYWDRDKNGDFRTAGDAFPDANWKEDELGIMHQVIAICEGLADRPKKRFFEKTLVVDEARKKGRE